MTAKPCYFGSTFIRTADGEVSVSSIQAGDYVTVYRDGNERSEPVIWVGHSIIDLNQHAHVEDVAPIRIRKDAIASNQPSRDLLVSPEHCMILNDRCVPAKLLINGGSITRDYPTEPFEYFHIELERHGILIAEGAYAESYLDTGNRSCFDNADVPSLLHPKFELNATSLRWQTDACAPLASIEHEVAGLWQTLADRSAQLGFVPAPVEAAADPDVHLLVDGKRIQPMSNQDGRYVFVVPQGAQAVLLASRHYIPADRMISDIRDTRRLGVRVGWMAIRQDAQETVLSADNPTLREGWHDAETDGATSWRWTDGAAMIPWDNVSDATVLTICCIVSNWYPINHQMAALAA